MFIISDYSLHLLNGPFSCTHNGWLIGADLMMYSLLSPDETGAHKKCQGYAFWEGDMGCIFHVLLESAGRLGGDQTPEDVHIYSFPV